MTRSSRPRLSWPGKPMRLTLALMAVAALSLLPLLGWAAVGAEAQALRQARAGAPALQARADLP